MIDKYISGICKLLEIEKPLISYDVSEFKSDTMLAQYQDGVLHLRKKLSPDPDYHFAIAHELRHAWQLKNAEAFYFSDYKTVDELGLEAYNNQPAEIDAHAFAMVVMVSFFGIMPLFDGLSAEIVEKIRQRSFEIADSLNGAE